MIPIRDTIRSRQFPLVNTMLILLNVLIFIYQVSLGASALDGPYAPPARREKQT